MSTVKSKKLQVGTDATSSNNFTIYQPSTPDGTLRIGVGNADSPTEVAKFDSNGLNRLGTATGDAPSYSARAWVNFDGTTASIRESGNVSSITDNGTGNFNINFATAMPDANYSVSGIMAVTANTVVGSISIYPSSTPTSSSVQIHVAQVNASSFAVRDAVYNYVNIFR